MLADACTCARPPSAASLPAPTLAAPSPARIPVETARALFAEVKAMLKGGDALTLDFHTLGYRPTPSDGFPIIGRAAGVDGLYVTVMHSGITLAPVVGLFATQELTTGRRDPLLGAYGLDRFSQ